MQYVGMYLAYVRAHLRRVLEYRASFFLGVTAIASRHTINLLMLWVIFSTVRSLGGWQPAQVLYLYGYVSLVIALWHLFFANTIRMEYLVRDATFDRYLIRPIPPLAQLLMYYFDDDALGDIIPAVLILAAASAMLDISLSGSRLVIFVLGLLGGVLLHFGIQLSISAWSFWFIKSRALINLFSDMRRFAEYPQKIFPLPLQFILCLVIPLAFSGYFAAERILSLTTLSLMAWLSLPVGLMMCGLGLLLWHAGLARYQSAGS